MLEQVLLYATVGTFVIVGIVLIIVSLQSTAAFPQGKRQRDFPSSEGDMSPIIGLIMYDDYAEDGELDIF
ncbi:MAG: hypothetical protein KAJ73_02255 [Zetaproteobacteria bacterium]|nr:hypothetical protein [Zetaproteobacteria bacterium]